MRTLHSPRLIIVSLFVLHSCVGNKITQLQRSHNASHATIDRAPSPVVPWHPVHPAKQPPPVDGFGLVHISDASNEELEMWVTFQAKDGLQPCYGATRPFGWPQGCCGTALSETSCVLVGMTELNLVKSPGCATSLLIGSKLPTDGKCLGVSQAEVTLYAKDPHTQQRVDVMDVTLADGWDRPVSITSSGEGVNVNVTSPHNNQFKAGCFPLSCKACTSPGGTSCPHHPEECHDAGPQSPPCTVQQASGPPVTVTFYHSSPATRSEPHHAHWYSRWLPASWRFGSWLWPWQHRRHSDRKPEQRVTYREITQYHLSVTGQSHTKKLFLLFNCWGAQNGASCHGGGRGFPDDCRPIPKDSPHYNPWMCTLDMGPGSDKTMHIVRSDQCQSTFSVAADVPPSTECDNAQAEFTLYTPMSGRLDVYDISLVNGFDQPLAIDSLDAKTQQVNKHIEATTARGNQRNLGVYPLYCDQCFKQFYPPCQDRAKDGECQVADGPGCEIYQPSGSDFRVTFGPQGKGNQHGQSKQPQAAPPYSGSDVHTPAEF